MGLSEPVSGSHVAADPGPDPGSSNTPPPPSCSLPPSLVSPSSPTSVNPRSTELPLPNPDLPSVPSPATDPAPSSGAVPHPVTFPRPDLAPAPPVIPSTAGGQDSAPHPGSGGLSPPILPLPPPSSSAPPSAPASPVAPAIVCGSDLAQAPRRDGSSSTVPPLLPSPALASDVQRPAPRLSFAQATRSGRGRGFVRAHALDVEPFARIPRTGINIICGSRDGLPSLSFASSDLPRVEEIFANALVMKFSGGRPSLEASHKEISSWGLENPFSIGPLSSKAFLLRFVDNRDLLKVLTRHSTILISFPYKICRWHSLCHLSEDSGFAPVWVSLPRLPLQCFVPEFLESVGNSIGRFLCFDRATTTLARPSSARICVEVDLRNPPPQFIWVGLFDGFKQQIIYERMPKFCVGCNRLGHATLECPKPCTGTPPSSAETLDAIVQLCTPAARQNAHSSASAVSHPTCCPAPPIHAGKPIGIVMSPHPTDSTTAQPSIPVEPQPKEPTSSSQPFPPYQEANASIQPVRANHSPSHNVGDHLHQKHSTPPQGEDSSDRTMALSDRKLQYQLHPCIRSRLEKINSASVPGQAAQAQSNVSANQDFWSAVNRQVAILDHARITTASPSTPSTLAANSQFVVDVPSQIIIPDPPQPVHYGDGSSESSIAADSPTHSPNMGSFSVLASYASEGEDHIAVAPNLHGYNTDEMLDKLPSIPRRNKRHPDKPLSVRLRGRKGRSSPNV